MVRILFCIVRCEGMNVEFEELQCTRSVSKRCLRSSCQYLGAAEQSLVAFAGTDRHQNCPFRVS